MKLANITLANGDVATPLPEARCVACDTRNCVTVDKIVSDFPDAAISGHGAIPAHKETFIRCLDCGEEEPLRLHLKGTEK